jgi:hypothetical protein
MNTWVIKDKIKNGTISFEIGDEVVIFWRKGNGYPSLINDDKVYRVDNIENEILYVRERNEKSFKKMPIRVHKTYMVPLYVIREIKLNSLLDETKLI